MERIHRRIDLAVDQEYVLERHCRINYACDSRWKREMPYAEYREEWLGLPGQMQGFLDALSESMGDTRTIAEIIQTVEGENMAYLWVPFVEDAESGFCFADAQDLYVEKPFRHAGLASELMEYAETRARDSGAKVIRSGTGCVNEKSIGLHKKLGFAPYRIEYEKVLHT